jgi:hypothetical protein
MAINLEKSINQIIDLLGALRFEIETRNKIGLFDINRLCEDVMIPVFKIAFGCPYLRNLNNEKKNNPGLDLGDDPARIAFQVTSDASLDKVKETLTKVVEHKSYLRYDTIYIYILTRRQKKYTKKIIQEATKGLFNFDPDKHIIDLSGFIEVINGLDYQLIRSIEQTLAIHLTNPKKYIYQPTPEKKESLTLNILPISFPKEIFIGQVNYKREEVIENARARGSKISNRCSQRTVVRAALEENDLPFSSDWVTRSDEIITFHNLNDEALPLASLVEPTTVGSLPVENYIRDEKGNLNIDHLNIFKELLRTTFQEQVKHRGVVWQHEEQVFIFKSLEKKPVRKEPWSGGKKEGRIVYQIHYWDEDQSSKQNQDENNDSVTTAPQDGLAKPRIKFHEHLAFEVGFDLYGDQWFLAVKPDVFCTFDGYKKSRLHRNRVSFLKRKEHNPDVLIDLFHITEILKKDQGETLLAVASGPRITLGDLVQLDGADPIPDNDWQQKDEKRKRKAFEAKTELPLFTNYVPGTDTRA